MCDPMTKLSVGKSSPLTPRNIKEQGAQGEWWTMDVRSKHNYSIIVTAKLTCSTQLSQPLNTRESTPFQLQG